MSTMLCAVPAELGFNQLVWLRDKMLERTPRETGGLITTHDAIMEFPNVTEDDPQHVYEMDLDMALAETTRAFWHTHPHSDSKPSNVDLVGMHKMYDNHLRFPWVIIGPKSVQAWEIRDRAASI